MPTTPTATPTTPTPTITDRRVTGNKNECLVFYVHHGGAVQKVHEITWTIGEFSYSVTFDFRSKKVSLSHSLQVIKSLMKYLQTLSHIVECLGKGNTSL